jgi:hypothetical protein
MRPVSAPETPLRRCRNQGASLGNSVAKRKAFRRTAIAAQLDPHPAGVQQAKQGLEFRIGRAILCRYLPHVIDHDRRRQICQTRRQHEQVRAIDIKLKMPAERSDAASKHVQLVNRRAIAADRVEARATHPTCVELTQICQVKTIINHRNGPRPSRAEFCNRIHRATVIRTVDARLNHDEALQSQRPGNPSIVRHRGFRRCIGPAEAKRISALGAENVKMAVGRTDRREPPRYRDLCARRLAVVHCLSRPTKPLQPKLRLPRHPAPRRRPHRPRRPPRRPAPPECRHRIR